MRILDAAVLGLLLVGDSGCRQADRPESTAHNESDKNDLTRLLENMGVRLRIREKQLEVSGRVNMRSGPVEVLACSPGGKLHESVLVLDCVPSGLHAGLLALGLKTGSPAGRKPDGELIPPTGDRVRIEVCWSGPEQRPERARAEDWLWNQQEKGPMKRQDWVFAGSYSRRLTGASEGEVYVADLVRSLVVTYHDPASILDTLDSGGSDDTFYHAQAPVPAGTEVTVIFSPAPAGGE